MSTLFTHSRGVLTLTICVKDMYELWVMSLVTFSFSMKLGQKTTVKIYRPCFCSETRSNQSQIPVILVHTYSKEGQLTRIMVLCLQRNELCHFSHLFMLFIELIGSCSCKRPTLSSYHKCHT